MAKPATFDGWSDRYTVDCERVSQITSRPDLHHLSALFGRREQLLAFRPDLAGLALQNDTFMPIFLT